MWQKKVKNLSALSFILIVLALISTIIISGNLTQAEDTLTAFRRETIYEQYLANHEGAAEPQVEIFIPATSFVDASDNVEIVSNLGEIAGEVITTGETGYVEWEVNVERAGFYNIELNYYPIPGRTSSIERDLWINGERPFAGARLLTFTRIWENESDIRVDRGGNEIRPPQIEAPFWRKVDISDSMGYLQEPYKFYFKEGINTIRLNSMSEPLALASLKLYQATEVKKYDIVAEEYKEKGFQPTEGFFKKILGQDARFKSHNYLFPVFDQGDPTVIPYHPAEIRLNAIGGHRWINPGEWLSWEFEVPESGLYQIAIKGKQDQQRGIFSNRLLRINGQVPFKEMEAIKFLPSNTYRMFSLGSEEEKYLFYLEEGKHELSLEVVLGDLAYFIEESEKSLYELNTIYRRIIMITSANPDPLRSYQLHQRIPELIERLGGQGDKFNEMAEFFEEITGEKGGHADLLRKIARMLEQMHDRPDRIPRLLGEYRDNIGALGTWITNTRRQPVQIDYIVVASPEQDLPRPTPTFAQTMLHEIRAFMTSFTFDYERVGDIGLSEDVEIAEGIEPIVVWLGGDIQGVPMQMGRDQAQVLKQMIEDSFTPETGIPVQLELIQGMQGLLIPATIAGTAPDVAVGSTNMELAFRGALTDLTQFPDFYDVTQRFKKSAFLPYTFRDQVFGMPETQAFNVMFYRQDVLDDLGLEIPETWDDVIAILPELQRNHMDFGLPANIFSLRMFLFQKGVALMKEDTIAANLESEAVIEEFRRLTNLFTLYNLPLVYNIQNRFRMGEMPLAIAGYGLYNTLQVFAPELRGEWGFTLVPGTMQEDGTINRTIPTESRGTVIMNNSTKKEKSWEFLKWWTSADIQARFGRELESLMGAAARYATANVEALPMLPWRPEERDLLLEQWDWVEGNPPVLGAYYVNRNFDWLFRAVVLQNAPIRETVQDYTRTINEEIARKRAEFGYETDINKLDDKWKQIYWDNYTHVYRLDIE